MVSHSRMWRYLVFFLLRQANYGEAREQEKDASVKAWWVPLESQFGFLPQQGVPTVWVFPEMSRGLNAYLTYWRTQASPLWQNVTFLWESKTQASEASGSRGEAVGQVDQWATAFTIWDESWRSRIPFLVLQRLGDEPYTWKKTKWCDLKKGWLSPQFPQNHRKFCQIHLT